MVRYLLIHVLLLLPSAFTSSHQPLLVGKNVISTSKTESSLTINQDSTELFFVRSDSFYNPSRKTIYHSRLINGQWSKPEVASFSGEFSDNSPFISHDGKWLYFSSNRPVGQKPKKDSDLWRVEKIEGQWSEPQHLGSLVNSSDSDYSPSIDIHGNLYFGSTRDSTGWGNLFISRFENGTFQLASALPPPINTEEGEWGSCISPDGRWLVFESNGRPDGLSYDGDLYLARKNTKDQWEEVYHLPFNSMKSDLSPKFFSKGASNKTIQVLFSSNRNEQEVDTDDVDIYQVYVNLSKYENE